MTANDLINILVDGIDKGIISSDSPVLTPDELNTYVILDNEGDVVYITDVDPKMRKYNAFVRECQDDQ